MRKKLLWICVLILMVSVSFANSKPIKFLGTDVEIMPLSDIKPGMIAYGKSDFGRPQGVENFGVRVTCVTQEPSIGGFVIWFKLIKGSNDITDATGVSMGMSGSPIYIRENGQEKLIGALAYGFGFQPVIPPIEADAGIQPIEAMLSLQNLVPAYYGSINIQPTTNPNILKPGEAIAGVILGGDMSIAAVGTVTLSNSRGFLAFGHPFFQTGYSNIPVFKAEIGMVVSTVISNFKYEKAIVEPQLGTIIVDSFTGILGVWHDQNTMLPLNINFCKHYLNSFQTDKKWAIKIAPQTLLSAAAFIYSINKAVELGSPDLNNLFLNIETTFTYREKGTDKTVSVFKSFFLKTGKEIPSNIKILADIYNMLMKARIELTNIDVNITATQEKGEVLTLSLLNVEAEKDLVKPKEEISLGLMLSDKYRNYSKVIKLKAPDFQGEVLISIQDRNCRLQELVNNALEDSSKLIEVLEFVNASLNKTNVFYVEMRHIKSIAERQGTDNNGWKVASKKTEEVINKEVVEVELPKIQEKFNVSISAQKKIIVTNNPDQGKKEDKNKNQ